MRKQSLLLLVVFAFVGCIDGGGGGGGGGSGGTDVDIYFEHPPSQGLSQPCCLSHGADACGAGLFCAAFDGRKIPTCYTENSRADRATCFQDNH